MLQIDEDAPPVPPLPFDHDNVRPISASSHQTDSRSSVTPVRPVPPLPVEGETIRKTEISARSNLASGPASAPLASTTGLRKPLVSRFNAGSDGKAKSATSSPRPVQGSEQSHMSQLHMASGPPSSFKPPRHETPTHQIPRSPSRPGAALSKASSILSRMSTLKPSRLRDPTKYQKLGDDTERNIPMGSVRTSQKSDPEGEESDVIPVAFDISSFEGPTHVPAHVRLPTVRQSKRRKHSYDENEQTDILESKGQLTGGIGIGMDEVVEAQIAPPRPQPPPIPQTQPSVAKRSGSRWMRRQPSTPRPVNQAAQDAADKTKQVVAVDGEIGVDITNMEGITGASTMSPDIDLIANEASKQSYYFPDDPEMPNWRPLPMRPWYLILLILIALTFGIVTEFLISKSKPPNYLMIFDRPEQINNGVWFVWKYLGEILLLSFGIMCQATDFEVRRLEPYYQMSQRTGSKAEQSLNMDYLTFWSYLIPFKAFRHRQWAVVCSSVATILASALVPVLYTAALNLEPDREERSHAPKKWVVMDDAWGRVMETTLYIIVLSIALLLYQQRRKSGLSGDLKGIAGIATMATKSHILNDFRGLDRASHRTIHKQLAHRRYILHKGSLWQGEYLTNNGAEEQEEPKSRNPHPVALHLPVGFAFMFSLIFFAILIPIIEFNDKANTVTDMAPWFLPLLATLLKLCWTNLETGVRMIEPFYHLSRRHAAPKILLLDYTGTIPGVMPIKASLNKHFILAAVGVGSLLMEVLTVCVSSFNVDGRTVLNNPKANGAGETARSYIISFVIAEMIPVILIVIGGFIYIRRRHAFLPRQPGTIASTLAFIHQSKMLWYFVPKDDDQDMGYSPIDSLGNRNNRPGALSKAKTYASMLSMSKLGPEKGVEMDVAEKAIRSLELDGKTYGLGWYNGRDGQDHLGVDEEELLANYEHGVDWSKGHLGGEAPGGWETF